jgi:Stress responsive A/B Barrel Domain
MSAVGRLRHVVLLRFQPGTVSADVQRVEQAFAALPQQIAQVQSLAWGINESPEGLDHGYTHCFTLHFADAAARDAYLVHPAHQAFSALARPHLAEVLVIDHQDR